MPIGIDTTVLTRTGPTGVAGPTAARFFVAGITAEGPSDRAVSVKSIGDYVSWYGDRGAMGSNVFDSVQAYFGEGGTEAVIARAVGASAVASSINISDRAASPLPTIKIAALSPGSWGDSLQVQILDGTLTNTVTVRVVRNSVEVERFTDVASPAALASATAASRWIRITTLGSTTTDPAQARPAVTALTNLTGGNDDRASVTATTVVTALTTLAPKTLGPGAVAAPGYDYSQVGAALIVHAKATGRVALMALPRTADKTAAITAGTNGAADGEYGALFWPWVIAPEGSDTKVIPPEGYVAGVRARAQSETGVWQAPPGVRSAARFITGTATPVDQSITNDLDAGRVNGIATLAGAVFLYNWRSLSTNLDQYRLLSSRDTLNSITASLETVLLQYVWATVDGSNTVFAAIEGAAKGVLQPLADQGGLYANDVNIDDNILITAEVGDPGYSVVVSATSQQLAANEIQVDVGVRLSPFAALIRLRITKANLTAQV